MKLQNIVKGITRINSCNQLESVVYGIGILKLLKLVFSML